MPNQCPECGKPIRLNAHHCPLHTLKSGMEILDTKHLETSIINPALRKAAKAQLQKDAEDREILDIKAKARQSAEKARKLIESRMKK